MGRLEIMGLWFALYFIRARFRPVAWWIINGVGILLWPFIGGLENLLLAIFWYWPQKQARTMTLKAQKRPGPSL
jgi:hypothetical protein